jgi:uncharacterized protein
MRPTDSLLPGSSDETASNWTFTLAATCITRISVARDRIFGKISSGAEVDPSEISIERLSIPNAESRLDAVVVRPVSRPVRAVVLICHGIGEIVEHWIPVQRLLAADEVASLVFDYSGYGRSPGFATPAQCERDAISAFGHLQALFPAMPISVLGFSMGSGIAVAILRSLPVHRLVLCAAFTSFKAAASHAGWPASLSFLVPDLWRTEEALRRCQVPVLLVHCGRDRLFPVQMASDLEKSCASPARLMVVSELGHNDPYYHPQSSYWKLVSDFLLDDRREQLPNSTDPIG